jgi:hypothetical protein
MDRNLMELGEIGLKVLLILEASELVILGLVEFQENGRLGVPFRGFVLVAQEEYIT